jgi:glyoxylase-like metal-dependent hydrolase (beta-lactamase superfamily II)
MQEIAPHVNIETTYAGVTLAAINWPHGLILIDSPFRPDDTRSWRSALLNLGGGVDRMMINLDGHFDRTLGARAMDCTVLGHEKMAQVFRNRPVTFKVQSAETGAEWELYNGMGSIRWAPPEITFTQQMSIHWDSSPLILEYHSGPSVGAIWAILPEQHIVFVGDAIMPDQPPFLANADVPAWIDTLHELSTPTYQDYLLVGGRGGLILQDQIHKQINYLTRVNQLLDPLAERKAAPEETESLVPALLKGISIPSERETQFTQRLHWGLYQYYARHYHPGEAEIVEE